MGVRTPLEGICGELWVTPSTMIDGSASLNLQNRAEFCANTCVGEICTYTSNELLSDNMPSSRVKFVARNLGGRGERAKVLGEYGPI